LHNQRARGGEEKKKHVRNLRSRGGKRLEGEKLFQDTPKWVKNQGGDQGGGHHAQRRKENKNGEKKTKECTSGISADGEKVNQELER